MNNICIMGRLTSAPEIKKTTSGVSVCSVSVAVDRDYKVNGEKATDFIPCIFWRGTAEFVGKYFKKGDMIAVVGSLESRKYKDKDGNNRTLWEVIADKVNFCGGKKEQDNTQDNRQDFEDVYDELSGEDLPF